MGSKEWLYRCNMCDFDAHMVCATATGTGTATKAIRLPPIQQQEATSRHNYHGTGFLHDNGRQSIYLNNNTNNPSSSPAGSPVSRYCYYSRTWLPDARPTTVRNRIIIKWQQRRIFDFDSLRNWSWRWRCKFRLLLLLILDLEIWISETSNIELRFLA